VELTKGSERCGACGVGMGFWRLGIREGGARCRMGWDATGRFTIKWEPELQLNKPCLSSPCSFELFFSLRECFPPAANQHKTNFCISQTLNCNVPLSLDLSYILNCNIPFSLDLSYILNCNILFSLDLLSCICFVNAYTS
jgi:hypothetical protein